MTDLLIAKANTIGFNDQSYSLESLQVLAANDSRMYMREDCLYLKPDNKLFFDHMVKLRTLLGSNVEVKVLANQQVLVESRKVMLQIKGIKNGSLFLYEELIAERVIYGFQEDYRTMEFIISTCWDNILKKYEAKDEN